MNKPTPPAPFTYVKRAATEMPLVFLSEAIDYGEAMAAWGAAQERERMQARIDALMLEYCPDEMSEEQKRNWAAHQVPAAQQGD